MGVRVLPTSYEQNSYILPIINSTSMDNSNSIIPNFVQHIEDYVNARFDFIKDVNKTLGDESSSLGKLLERAHEYPDHLGWKEQSYFRRFFSSESWGEWFSRRTSLGKVIDVFQSESYQALSKNILQQANKEAQQIQFSRLTSSCPVNLALGALMSQITNSPVPMIVSLSHCMPLATGTQLRQPAVREFLDKLQAGSLKTVDDSVKEQLINLGNQDFDDNTLVTLIVETVDKATSLLSNPVKWALDELYQDLTIANAQLGAELLQALKKKEKILDKTALKVNLSKVQSEIRQVTDFWKEAKAFVDEQDQYLNKNANILSQVEEYLNPQNLFNQYRDRHKELELEIRTRTDNIGQLREVLKELKRGMYDNWTILKEGYYPEDVEFAKAYNDLDDAQQKAWQALDVGRANLQEQKRLKAESERQLLHLQAEIKNGGSKQDREIRATYIQLKNEDAEVRQVRSHNQKELTKAEATLARLRESEILIKNSLKDEL